MGLADTRGTCASPRLRAEQVSRRSITPGTRTGAAAPNATGVPAIGVLPYMEDLRLPEEDAASLVERRVHNTLVDFAVIHVPHLANFDEFGPLAAEPGVRVRYVSQPVELRAPDLVILPGSKATIPDLLWLTDPRAG